MLWVPLGAPVGDAKKQHRVACFHQRFKKDCERSHNGKKTVWFFRDSVLLAALDPVLHLKLAPHRRGFLTSVNFDAPIA